MKVSCIQGKSDSTVVFSPCMWKCQTYGTPLKKYLLATHKVRAACSVLLLLLGNPLNQWWHVRTQFSHSRPWLCICILSRLALLLIFLIFYQCMFIEQNDGFYNDIFVQACNIMFGHSHSLLTSLIPSLHSCKSPSILQIVLLILCNMCIYIYGCGGAGL